MKNWSHNTSATGSYGRQANKLLLHLEVLKSYTGQNIGIFAVFRMIQCHYNGDQYISGSFSYNLYPNMGFRDCEYHCFSGQSLLLSTIVLNDNLVVAMQEAIVQLNTKFNPSL